MSIVTADFQSTDMSRYSAAGVLNALNIGLSQYPEAPSLRFSYDVVAKTCAETGTPTLQTRKEACRLLTGIARSRLNLFNYAENFLKVYDAKPGNMEALKIAVLCDKEIAEVLYALKKNPDVPEINGFKRNDVVWASLYANEAILICGGNPNLDDEDGQDEDDVEPDNTPAPWNGKVSERPPENDNDKDTGLQVESFFVAYVLAHEQIEYFTMMFPDVDATTVEMFRNDLRIMSGFTDVETDIGLSLWDKIEKIESIIESYSASPAPTVPGI